MSLYRQGLAVGASEPPKQGGDSVITFVILGVITAIIIVASPGARHYYRHGKLPPG